MKSIRARRFCVFSIFVAGLVLAICGHPIDCWSQASGAQARVALLIGNASYPDTTTPLRQPGNNIRLLADELRRNGFQVDAKENLGKLDLLRALDEFRRRIEPDSTAFLFFSGYGLQKD